MTQLPTGEHFSNYLFLKAAYRNISQLEDRWPYVSLVSISFPI